MAVRKRSSAMTPAERTMFRNVMTQLINAPGDPNPYGIMVGHHRDMSHRMHGRMGGMVDPVGRQRFLSWHRVYLLKVEKMGQAINPAFFIPYWDWATSPAVPPWFSGFGPLIVKVAGVNISVNRNPPAPPPHNTLPTNAQVTSCLGKATYTAFTRAVEEGFGVVPAPVGAGMHNRVHVWCNGSMSFVPDAPADPLFWLHHAMIDRMWSQWQATHPGLNPSLAGAFNIMDPWPETATNVKSIAVLGYSYGP